LNTRFWYDTIIKLLKQEHYMNLWMEPLGDPLTICPIKTGRGISIEPYLSSQIRCIYNLCRQVGHTVVWTWTWSDGPEPFPTQQRINARDSISESEWLCWSHMCTAPCALVYNLRLVYQGTLDLFCWVLCSWTAVRLSVKADQLLKASISWVVFFSKEAQKSLVQCKMPVGRHHGTCGGAVMMPAPQRSGSLSGYDSRRINIDWSAWIGEDCMCCISTSTTRCTLTHTQRNDHTNTNCPGAVNSQVDLVEKAPQIAVRRV